MPQRVPSTGTLEAQIVELRRTTTWTVIGGIFASILAGSGVQWWTHNRDLTTYEQVVDMIRDKAPVNERDRAAIEQSLKSTTEEVKSVREKVEEIGTSQAKMAQKLDDMMVQLNNHNANHSR